MSAFDEISDRLASRRLPQSVELPRDGTASAQLIGGLSAEDAEIVQSMLKFYDKFAANNAAEAVVDLATAKVHARMGDIRARLGQYEQAASAYQRAIVIGRDLDDQSFSEADLVLFLAQTLDSLGTVRLKRGDFQGSKEAHHQALKQLDAVPSKLAGRPIFRHQLALTLNNLVLTRSAEFIHQLGRRGPRRPGLESRVVAPPEIQEEYEEALTLLDGLIRDDPQNVRYQLALARCHRSVLAVAWANENDDLATTAKQHSIAILQELADAVPDDPAYEFELADTLAMNAHSDSRTRLSEPDVADLKRSIDITARLQGRFPTAREFAVLAANTHQKLGAHLAAAKEWGESEEHLTKAAGLLEQLVASVPKNPLLHASLARVRWELADVVRRQGSSERAREILERAISEYQAFRNSDTGRRSSPGLLVGLFRQLARTLEQLGEQDLADDATRSADRLRDSSHGMNAKSPRDAF